MSSAAGPLQALPEPVVAPPVRRRRARARVSTWLASVVVGIFALIAVFGPALAPFGQAEQAGVPYTAPSGAHLLGLDDAGVDMFSALMYGTRASLIVAVGATAISLMFALLVGVTAGYFGGAVDTVLMRVTDYLLVIPTLPLMIVIAALYGSSLTYVVIIIGVTGWPSVAILLRAQTKTLRSRGYVRRAELLGVGRTRVITTHVLPHLGSLVAANASLLAAGAIFSEAALSFLGLSDPSTPSWGKLIDNAFRSGAVTVRAWWTIVPPGAAIAIVVLCLTLLGRSVEDRLNPRLIAGQLTGTGTVRRGDERA